jgi:hypothetical protein
MESRDGGRQVVADIMPQSASCGTVIPRRAATPSEGYALPATGTPGRCLRRHAGQRSLALLTADG